MRAIEVEHRGGDDLPGGEAAGEEAGDGAGSGWPMPVASGGLLVDVLERYGGCKWGETCLKR